MISTNSNIMETLKLIYKVLFLTLNVCWLVVFSSEKTIKYFEDKPKVKKYLQLANSMVLELAFLIGAIIVFFG